MSHGKEQHQCAQAQTSQTRATPAQVWQVQRAPHAQAVTRATTALQQACDVKKRQRAMCNVQEQVQTRAKHPGDRDVLRLYGTGTVGTRVPYGTGPGLYYGYW